MMDGIRVEMEFERTILGYLSEGPLPSPALARRFSIRDEDMRAKLRDMENEGKVRNVRRKWGS